MSLQEEFAAKILPCDFTSGMGLSLRFIPASWGGENFVVVEVLRDEKNIMQFVYSRKEWRKVKRAIW
jgi:hypothetical protein